ncbi:Imm49 family immunity protein [uncultured Photobacterium sp.]|uniref:Imm49 family immunity protein n=1 Tax=uncultured Photobacterium sp. TaxID=173973 RepID=UPI00262F2DFE|nr:Imm49 family immunity protein [uncultured Photobacterium sp.]
MMKFEHHIYGVPSKPMDWMEEDYFDELKMYQKNTQKFYDGLMLNVSYKRSHELFVYSSLLKKSNTEIIRHLYDYLQALMMDLQPYIHKGRGYSVTFHGKTVLKEAQPSRKLHLSQWLQAFYVTLILRDPFDQLKDLVAIDDSDFRAWDENNENDIRRVLYRLYQGFFGHGKKELTTLIGDVIEFSAPEFVGDGEAQDFVNYLYLPLTQMLVYAHTKDRAVKYPEKLMHSLESHRRYYTEISGDPNDVCNKWGWLSLGITAFAAHAYDAFGLVPDVDTEYMPMWLVKGEFPCYEAAFPELIHAPKPQYKDFEFTASHMEEGLDWRPIWLATIKWAKAEPNLPIVCEVIGKKVDSLSVDKTLQGEVFIDVLGNEPPVFKLYSMEPCLLGEPEKWLIDMKQKWKEHVSSILPEAETSAHFIDG